jgi:hypothetical protein
LALAGRLFQEAIDRYVFALSMTKAMVSALTFVFPFSNPRSDMRIWLSCLKPAPSSDLFAQLRAHPSIVRMELAVDDLLENFYRILNKSNTDLGSDIVLVEVFFPLLRYQQ